MESGVPMPDFLTGLLPHRACHTARWPPVVTQTKQAACPMVWLDPWSWEGERRGLDTDTVALFHILIDEHH